MASNCGSPIIITQLHYMDETSWSAPTPPAIGDNVEFDIWLGNDERRQARHVMALD